MTSDGKETALVYSKDFLERPMQAHRLRRVGLPLIRLPEVVRLAETRLESVGGEFGVDV